MMPLGFTRADFPESFLFGTATSSYQIEGHSFGGAGRTHWDDFAATPGNVVRAENGDVACDHYHRMDEDLDLIRDLNVDCYRFSTSWARVMPEGRGAPNAEGLDFYDRLADGLLARGLKPCATLYHWELPSPLADLGGWRNPDLPYWFAEFTHTIMSRIGDRMYSVAPINEPWCVGWLSHFLGHHAPGLRDLRATARAMHHVLKAHGTAIEAMRGLGMTNLGAVCNFEYPNPADGSAEAQAAAARYDATYNQFFLSGLFHGRYPDLAMEGLGPHLPEGWEDDFALITQPLDWVGLNYYTRKNIAADDGPWPALKEVSGPLPKTSMGWEIFPQGLHHFLTMVHRDYTKGLPLIVTENGMSSADALIGDRVEDPQRIAYLADHIAQVKRALDEGVPVAGYFIWSLMDNYEWALGYEKRFGLVHVDFDTLTRTPKASYHALGDALRRAATD
jgi:beta-glucosidase